MQTGEAVYVDGRTRLTRCMKKTWWDYDRWDMRSLGFPVGLGIRINGDRESRGNQLTQIY